MLSNLKNKLTSLKIKRKIRYNQKYWIYHQRGIRQARKYKYEPYLLFFTFERNYKLIKLFSKTIHD